MFPPIPTPPEITRAPLCGDCESTKLTMYEIPFTVSSSPIFTLFAIPTPPPTTRAPEVESIESEPLLSNTSPEMDIAPYVRTFPPTKTLPDIPAPPATKRAPEVVDTESFVFVILV